MSDKYIRIVLTPLAPYFLGGERGLKYTDNDTQMSRGEKYYIKSNLMPNQSALFGVLRFLGIEKTDSSYFLQKDDKDRIGEKSYRLNDPSVNKFGMIRKISPLYLMRKEDKELFFPAPMLISAMESADKDARNRYECLATDCGKRWIPLYYSEKDADLFRFIGLSDGKLLKKKNDCFTYPFRYQTRVVINRKRNYKNGISTYPEKDKDFLKKDYVILDGFNFVFYAKVDSELFDFSKEDKKIIKNPSSWDRANAPLPPKSATRAIAANK